MDALGGGFINPFLGPICRWPLTSPATNQSDGDQLRYFLAALFRLAGDACVEIKVLRHHCARLAGNADCS